MRWLHLDDLEEIRRGEYARTVKAVPSYADYLENHFPGFPVMPESLLIESMAQTAGILIGTLNDFARDVILAKIESAEFLSMVRPGDRLIIEARMEESREEGAKVRCRISLDGEQVGSAVLIFAILPEGGDRRPEAASFVFSSALIKLFKLRKGSFS